MLTKLPSARREDGHTLKRLPGRKATRADREELPRIWTLVSEDGRKVMLFFAAQLAKNESCPRASDRPAHTACEQAINHRTASTIAPGKS